MKQITLVLGTLFNILSGCNSDFAFVETIFRCDFHDDFDSLSEDRIHTFILRADRK